MSELPVPSLNVALPSTIHAPLRPKLIVFDLNKTLIHENTWRNLNLALGVTAAEDELLVAWGDEGIISDAEGQAILCSIYQRRGQPSRGKITKLLHDYTYLPQARQTIEKLRELDIPIALLSGSIDLLVTAVAAELGVTRWACNNSFIFASNDMLAQIATIDNDDSYKLRQLETICLEMRIALTDCMCVGDGENDVLLFRACGNGVTFKDSAYAAEAKHTVTTLDEILELV